LREWQEAEGALGGPVFSNQVQFSLIKRGPEADLVPWAQANGHVVIAYSPLGQGLLSGRYQKSAPRNFRRMRREFSAQSRARLEPLLAALHEVAAKHSATEAQVALAWLIRKPNVVAIPGASSVRQVEENVGAAEVDLTDEEDARLGGLVSEGL
jgi:aryl-alcohol dehydrogenase-like predicted oxidoreductase